MDLTASAACGPDGILCPPHRLGSNSGPLILPYPEIDPEEIPNIGHKDEVIQQYDLIRKWLFKNSGYQYIDQYTGMINDQVLLAMIISGEFSEFNQDSPVYNEALEALSNQYHSTYGTLQTPCNGNCVDIKSHLIWLQTMESFYDGKIYGSILERGADSWLIYMESANNAINGWNYRPSSDSWV